MPGDPVCADLASGRGGPSSLQFAWLLLQPVNGPLAVCQACWRETKALQKAAEEDSVFTRPGFEQVKNKHHLRLVLRLLNQESWCVQKIQVWLRVPWPDWSVSVTPAP